jgi:predicted ArsR family transcriptional regulator
VLGPGVAVERAEHIISGDHRCVYKVKEKLSTQRRKDAK